MSIFELDLALRMNWFSARCLHEDSDKAYENGNWHIEYVERKGHVLIKSAVFFGAFQVNNFDYHPNERSLYYKNEDGEGFCISLH